MAITPKLDEHLRKLDANERQAALQSIDPIELSKQQLSGIQAGERAEQAQRDAEAREEENAASNDEAKRRFEEAFEHFMELSKGLQQATRGFEGWLNMMLETFDWVKAGATALNEKMQPMTMIGRYIASPALNAAWAGGGLAADGAYTTAETAFNLLTGRESISDVATNVTDALGNAGESLQEMVFAPKLKVARSILNDSVSLDAENKLVVDFPPDALHPSATDEYKKGLQELTAAMFERVISDNGYRAEKDPQNQRTGRYVSKTDNSLLTDAQFQAFKPQMEAQAKKQSIKVIDEDAESRARNENSSGYNSSPTPRRG